MLYRVFVMAGHGFGNFLLADFCMALATYVNQQLIQEKHLKLFLSQNTQKSPIEAIIFNLGKVIENKKIKIAYSLDINYFNDQQSLQLILEYVDILLISNKKLCTERLS